LPVFFLFIGVVLQSQDTSIEWSLHQSWLQGVLLLYYFNLHFLCNAVT